MKSVQKFGSLLLAVLMILSLAACGNKMNNTPAQTPSDDTPSESTPAGCGIVCFSICGIVRRFGGSAFR